MSTERFEHLDERSPESQLLGGMVDDMAELARALKGHAAVSRSLVETLPILPLGKLNWQALANGFWVGATKKSDSDGTVGVEIDCTFRISRNEIELEQRADAFKIGLPQKEGKDYDFFYPQKQADGEFEIVSPDEMTLGYDTLASYATFISELKQRSMVILEVDE